MYITVEYLNIQVLLIIIKVEFVLFEYKTHSNYLNNRFSNKPYSII